MTNKELLEHAKIYYPLYTRYLSADDNGKCSIQGILKLLILSDGPAIGDGYGGFVYYNDQWARYDNDTQLQKDLIVVRKLIYDD